MGKAMCMRVAIVAGLALVACVLRGEGSESTPTENAVVWGEEREGLRIGIHGGEEHAFSSMQPVVLRVTLENVLDEPSGHVTLTHTERDYEIIVRDGKGNDVPRTRYGALRARNAGRNFRRIFKRMEPGETLEETLHVNRMFDMTLNDTYSIQLSRREVYKRDEDAYLKVESKSIQVTITHE